MTTFLIIGLAFIIFVAIALAIFSCLPNSTYSLFENPSEKLPDDVIKEEGKKKE